MVDEPSSAEAATVAFERAYERFGKNIKVSPNILVIDLCKVIDGQCEDSMKLMDTPTVLADAGLHQLSKQFKKIILGE